MDGVSLSLLTYTTTNTFSFFTNEGLGGGGGRGCTSLFVFCTWTSCGPGRWEKEEVDEVHPEGGIGSNSQKTYGTTTGVGGTFGVVHGVSRLSAFPMFRRFLRGVSVAVANRPVRCHGREGADYCVFETS